MRKFIERIKVIDMEICYRIIAALESVPNGESWGSKYEVDVFPYETKDGYDLNIYKKEGPLND